jgi:hypothetical protein
MRIVTFSPRKTILIFFVLLLISFFYSCSSVKPLTTASYFRFDFDDEAYRIRSVSSVDNGNSYNELIGKHFVAIDYDKDRVIDKITLGEENLLQAQEIYDYGLNILISKDMIQVYSVKTVNYFHENSDFDYQIKSFHPIGSEPFNEFKIIRKHELEDIEIIMVDKKADGTLDEVLKGPIKEVADYQARYNYVISSGLEKNRLVKEGEKIFVKQK